VEFRNHSKKRGVIRKALRVGNKILTKVRKIIFLLTVVAFLFSSCASHRGFTTNSTEVVLSEKNFKVVERLQGEAEVTYIFGIGGLSKSAVIAEARADMLSKSNIVGDSKAIINETIEVKRSRLLAVLHYKVIVSSHIVEFTE